MDKMDFDKALGKKEEVKEKTNEEEPVFTISVKKEEKPNRKTFNVYMEADMVKEVDTIAKRTKRNRNEIINMMVEFCLENLEIK